MLVRFLLQGITEMQQVRKTNHLVFNIMLLSTPKVLSSSLELFF